MYSPLVKTRIKCNGAALNKKSLLKGAASQHYWPVAIGNAIAGAVGGGVAGGTVSGVT